MSDLRRTIGIATLANYASLVARLGLGLWTTKLLFTGLENAEYGFWAILWSVFGYSVLVDFGFGTAIQKAVSEAVATGDWSRASRLASTAAVSYGALGLLIAAGSVVAAPLLPQLLSLPANASSDAIASYQRAFVVFGVGTGLAFATGFWVEVLRGGGAIPVRNAVTTSGAFLNAALLWVSVRAGWGVEGLAWVSGAAQLATNAALAVAARRRVPALLVAPRLFDRGALGEVTGFSLYAYLVTFTNLVIFRTDQLVIGTCLSVSLVAGYQVVSRLAEMFRLFTAQLNDALAPAATALAAAGQTDRLRSTLLGSGRVTLAVATALFLPTAVFFEPLLAAWLDLRDPAALSAGAFLLVSMYVLVALRTTHAQVFLVIGRHRELAGTALAECAANLALSIALALWTPLGILGVALGTLLPNLVLALAYSIPSQLRFTGLSLVAWARTITVGVPVAAAVSLAVHLAARALLPDEPSLVAIALAALPGVTVAAVIGGASLLPRHRLPASLSAPFRRLASR